MGNAAKASRDKCRKKTRPSFPAFIIVFSILFITFAGFIHAASVSGESAVEVRIARFVRDIYPDRGDSIRVKLNSIPSALKENTKVVNINFVKIPDANGDGICAVEVRNSAGRTQTVQVPFKVFSKRQLFVLKYAVQKGDLISEKDLIIRETYMNGKANGYPASLEDVVGKAVKRDLPANTVLADQAIEDRVLMKRGDIVTIIAESNKLVVQAKGRTIDKGRIGETVRVKNIASGKELTGKVVSGTAVKVEF